MYENEKIKEARKALYLTQQDVADVLGVSKQYISKVEKGLTELSKEKMAIFCSEFGISMEWLLLDKGEMIYEEPVEPDESEEPSDKLSDMILCMEVEGEFKLDTILQIYSLYITESIDIIKKKYPNAVYEDIVEATRDLFTTDITFYDTMEELENKLDEFKNRGRLYKLFQERIFNAYNKTYNAKIINNRFGNKGLA